jgi:acyl-CoA synthetase (AMP-forming)/AMP-acid ligase II
MTPAGPSRADGLPWAVMQVEAGVLIRTAAQNFGSRTALTAGSRHLTFTQLNDLSNRVGSALTELGMARGDRVGVLAHNTPELVETWFGCEKHNLVRVVLHSHITMDSHVWSLNNVRASALIFDTRFAADVERRKGEFKSVRHFVAIGPGCPDWAIPFATLESGGSAEDPRINVDEDDLCFLQLTSGTTGHPKAWVKTHRSWRAVINHNLIHFDTFGPGVPPVGSDDVNLHFHPIQWASGFQTLFPYYLRGARTVLLDDAVFSADVLLDTIVSEQVTGLFMPGPLLTSVLDAVEERGGSAHRLRRMVVFFGTPDQLDRTSRLLGPVWAHGFGSTEQGAAATRLLPHEVEERRERIKSVGRPGSPFLEVAIVDEQGSRLDAGQVGEIVVRSPMSVGEYWGMPERTARSFFPGDWFRPYDLGYLDEDGFLYYYGRVADKISTARGTVYPHLVEEPILGHRAVFLCGVVGLGAPGEEEVVACVQLKEGYPPSEQLAAEILRQTAELQAHERPVRVMFVSELPTVLGGAKVQHQALRELLIAGQALRSRRRGVPLDELVSDLIEVLADVVRLRADIQRRVALTKDERALPASRAGADRVPDVARDQADVAGSDLERGGYRVVGLLGRLVPLDGLVDAEAALEQVDHARLLQLPARDLQRVVGEREQPEAVLVELAQGRGDFGVGRHRGEPVGELGGVRVPDGDTAGGGEHPEHGAADVGERDVYAGQRERLGVGDQVREPQPHGGRVVENPVKDRVDPIEVEQGLVDVEDDDRLLGHGGRTFRRGCGVPPQHKHRHHGPSAHRQVGYARRPRQAGPPVR